MYKYLLTLLIALLATTPLAAQDTLLYWQEGATRRVMLPLAADDDNPADDSQTLALAAATPALMRQIDSAYTANGREHYNLPYLILITNGRVANGEYRITALKAIEPINERNAVAFYDYWANGYEPGWDLLVSRRLGKLLFRNFAADVDNEAITVFPYTEPTVPTMRQSTWYVAQNGAGTQLHAVFTDEVCSVAISGYKVRCEVILSNYGAYSGCAATPQMLPVDNE